MTKAENKSENVTVSRSHRGANIAVIIVASIAALILIAIAILCGVRSNPMSDVEKPEYYEFYNRGDSSRAPTNSTTKSNIAVAMDSMDYTVMSAILQWHWDLSYNFKRNAEDKKVEISAEEVIAVTSSSKEYMVEYVYKTLPIVNGEIDYTDAQSIEVDGETVYFDRLKVLIGNTEGKVGTISIYPYVYARVHSGSDIDGLSPDDYKVTGINVRANTTKAFAALGDVAASLGLKTDIPEEPAETEEQTETDGETETETKTE